LRLRDRSREGRRVPERICRHDGTRFASLPPKSWCALGATQHLTALYVGPGGDSAANRLLPRSMDCLQGMENSAGPIRWATEMYYRNCAAHDFAIWIVSVNHSHRSRRGNGCWAIRILEDWQEAVRRRCAVPSCGWRLIANRSPPVRSRASVVSSGPAPELGGHEEGHFYPRPVTRAVMQQPAHSRNRPTARPEEPFDILRHPGSLAVVVRSSRGTVRDEVFGLSALPRSSVDVPTRHISSVAVGRFIGYGLYFYHRIRTVWLKLLRAMSSAIRFSEGIP